MKKEYFHIKSQCRKGLLPYLEHALSFIPNDGHYRVLDIGCGTGVPTLFLAENIKCSITAIDTDMPALDFFRDTVKEKNLHKKISIRNVSLFDFDDEKNSFDIILAEGFLNVVGFENGFKRAMEFLKPGGYFIIHDEFKDHEGKIGFISRQNCTLFDSLYLDETIWWNHYYSSLNTQIKSIVNPELLSCFKGDISEIEYFETNPDVFRSIYYVIGNCKI